jgi:chemotaxis protein methyltransferase CheR
MQNSSNYKILKLLQDQRGLDFLGHRVTMVQRRIAKRLLAVKCNSEEDYLSYLNENPTEMDHLIDVLTINVSEFFRNPLTFEYLYSQIIHQIVEKKSIEKGSSIRVWSAGCARGEEAYSLAIQFEDYMQKENLHLETRVFATDIDPKAIQNAKEGIYKDHSILNLKYHQMDKYFLKYEDGFHLKDKIKKNVHFSFHDLLSTSQLAPPESIYGGFDLILCRNVLIYFDINYQKRIFEKLHRNLGPHGYLVLGDSEVLHKDFKNDFKRLNTCCKVFQKKDGQLINY